MIELSGSKRSMQVKIKKKKEADRAKIKHIT
jgi:hypothetical protein